MQHAAALGSLAGTAAGRELHDHAGTMLAQALQQLAETILIRGRGLIVLAHVHVRDGRSRFEGFLRRLDLFGDADRYRRIVFLARHGAGDGDRYDARIWHDAYLAADMLKRSCVMPRA